MIVLNLIVSYFRAFNGHRILVSWINLDQYEYGGEQGSLLK